jgi:hypothetical protein
MALVIRKRPGALVAWAVAGGVMLSFAATLTSVHPHVVRHLGLVLLGGLAGAVIGAFVGLVSAIVVVPTLLRKDAIVALPLAYALTLPVTIVTTWRSDPFTAVVPSFLTLAGVCVVLWLALPNLLSKHPRGCCSRCGYDRRRASTSRCPECGERDRSAALRAVRRMKPIRIRVLGVIAATAIIGAGWCLGQWSVALRFTAANVQSIETGMTADDVYALVGPPSRTSQYQGVTSWEYSEGGWVFPDTSYCVEFSSDKVIRVIVDTW